MAISEREQSEWRRPVESDGTNVGDIERAVSGIGGAALLVAGFRRRDPMGLALALCGGLLAYRGLTGHSRLYDALGLHLVRTTTGSHRIEVIKTLTIKRSSEDLYRFWRHFENLPKVMRHVESIRVLDDKRSHWTVRGPGETVVEWDAEIVNEKENTLIAWQSCEGSDVAHWGVVRFRPAPGERGTEVTIELEYEPVGGAMGAAIAKLFGQEPAQQIGEDLRRFKQIMETGEVLTTEGQPRG